MSRSQVKAIAVKITIDSIGFNINIWVRDDFGAISMFSYTHTCPSWISCVSDWKYHSSWVLEHNSVTPLSNLTSSVDSSPSISLCSWFHTADHWLVFGSYQNQSQFCSMSQTPSGFSIFFPVSYTSPVPAATSKLSNLLEPYDNI